MTRKSPLKPYGKAPWARCDVRRNGYFGSDMQTPTGPLERELVQDLDGLADRLADERFCEELCGTLSNGALSKEGHPGHIALNWTRAADFLNGVRSNHGFAPLALLEAEERRPVTGDAAEELGRRGWSSRPLRGSG